MNYRSGTSYRSRRTLAGALASSTLTVGYRNPYAYRTSLPYRSRIVSMGTVSVRIQGDAFIPRVGRSPFEVRLRSATS